MREAGGTRGRVPSMPTSHLSHPHHICLTHIPSASPTSHSPRLPPVLPLPYPTHPLSCSISAWNYIQLPTPCSSRIFKHRLLTNQHSHLYPNDHHHTAHVSQHSITMLSPYSNKSF